MRVAAYPSTAEGLSATGDTYAFHARDRCPGCRHAVSSLLYSAPFDTGGIGVLCRSYYNIDPACLQAAPFELRRCERCTLVFQHHVGSPALLHDLYTYWVDNPSEPEAEIDSYRQDMTAPMLSRDAHEIMTAAAHLGRRPETMKTLDYGMGWALWARIAAMLGTESWGLDLNAARQAYAARHGVRTTTDDEIAGSNYHFINVDQVLEHVAAPLDLLQRLASGLAADGVLKISVPSAHRAPAIVGMLNAGTYRGDHATIMPLHPLEHVNSFTRDALRKVVACAGLVPVRPSLASRYAFLRHPGSLSPLRPRAVAKELVRPLWQWRSRGNIYAWLRKADTP